MRGCIYCQSEKNPYSLIRALRLCNALVPACEVTLLTSASATSLDFPLRQPGWKELLLLPGISLEASFEKEERLADLKERRRAIRSIEKEPFDFLVTETFPFGKKGLKVEVLDLIAQVKKGNPKAKIFCLFHGHGKLVKIDGQVDSAAEEAAAALLNEYYDHLFIASDPELVPFADCFEAVDKISIPLTHTGFLAGTPKPIPPKEKELLVVGSSTPMGRALVQAAAIVSSRITHYHWTFMLGPEEKREEREGLARVLDNIGLNNVELLPFKAEVGEFIAPAALTLSLGENLLAESLLGRAYSLTLSVPFNDPHKLLLRRFEQLGVSHQIRINEFSPPALEALILQLLENGFPDPAPAVRIDDGKLLAGELLKLLGKRG